MVTSVKIQNMDTLALMGDVTSENVVSIRAEGENLISRITSSGVIDLGGLSSANTITLSLLLSWLRFAKSRSVVLTVRQASAKLFDMARVSGLDHILPFEAEDDLI